MENKNLTIRQLAGLEKMRKNSADVARFFELRRAGDETGARKIYEGMPEGLRRGIDNSLAAMSGNPDPKSAEQIAHNRDLFAAVKTSDIAGAIAAFGRFSEKARPGVLKTLTSMVEAGRVTPAMATAIGELAAA